MGPEDRNVLRFHPLVDDRANDPGGLAEIDTDRQCPANDLVRHLGRHILLARGPQGRRQRQSHGRLRQRGSGGARDRSHRWGPATGSLVKTFPGLGGTDELWYDPAADAFYVTGNDGTNTTRFFDIVPDDGAGIISQMVDLPATTSAHSITVDPFNGDVFVALAGTTALDPCPATQANPGCIAVFAPVVPEPGSLPVLLVGLAGLMGLALRRRLQKLA